MKPIAIVIPWYGEGIKGGAEHEANLLAHALNDSGVNVEVFTTCVKEASDDRGKNVLESGVRIENGILVRRFLVRKRNEDVFHAANVKLYAGKNISYWTLDDEIDYFSEDINSPEMYMYIDENKDRYAAFLFLPYMYGVVYNGTKYCPDNCFLIPCLHDESYARMRLVKKMVERIAYPQKNAHGGVIFHSKPEADLAKQLYGFEKSRYDVLGEVVETDWITNVDADRFRKKYNIKGDFILYAGRKDPGKKADELLYFFQKYIEETKRDLSLVFIGGGKLDVPASIKKYVYDLGFVDDSDKHDAFAACSFLCNPSRFESFSLVIMETWLAKRPVLVSSECAVTSNFCHESGAGLCYAGYQEFCECVNSLLADKTFAKEMGEKGHEFVMQNFTSQKIAKKYLDFIGIKI